MSTTGEPQRLAVLVSGAGRSLANLLERSAAGSLPARVVVVVASRAGLPAETLARRHGVETRVLPRGGLDASAWSAAVFGACREAGATLVVMAGWLHLLPVPGDFADRTINIHPSLLPAFGGKGFHGLHVHRAVLARGCTVSGCTVHLVDDEYDHGRILVQRTVPVLADDTAESLAARVFAAECVALPEAIGRFAAGSLP